GVAGLAIDLGKRDRARGQAVEEVVHRVRGRIKRRQERWRGDLGPGGLPYAVAEEGTLRGHAIEVGRRRALVAVRADVVAPQRVGPDEDDPLRSGGRPRGAGRLGFRAEVP